MTPLQELSYPIEYYCDEIREGFFVSETMKRYWAAQLEVLAEVDKVCKDHDITWCAYCGTMLGAVRHKGYIPWDDDIDIGMFRDDYKKFIDCAEKELPDGYRVLSSKKESCKVPFGRVVNNDELGLQPDFLNKYHGCPFAVGIDIFPFDGIFPDSNMEENRKARGKYIFDLITALREGDLSDEDVKKLVLRAQHENNCVIDGDNILRSLVLLFEKIAQECKDENANEIASMTGWTTLSKFRWLREWYAEYTDMPFETTKVRVPVKYDEILTACYGDYMNPQRHGSWHDYPLYQVQEKVIFDRYGRYPSGRFHFDRDIFKPTMNRRSYRTEQKNLLTYMHGFHENILEKVEREEYEDAAKYLETCQKAAVTIGNSLEGKYGEGTDAVHALEEYCEKIYEVSENWDENSKSALDRSLELAEGCIEKLFDSAKKEVLFLLCRASWWESIRDVYNTVTNDKKNSVKVIPIPYSFLDHNKNLLGWKTDLDEFEKIPELGCNITCFEEYHPEIKRPDVIVIQFPYDGYSGILAIPENLFSDKLSDYTDELVFVPHLIPDVPNSCEDIAYAAMRELVEQAAVFNADRIIVSSEALKKYYVKKLVDISGEDLKSYWDKKICTKESI